MSWHVTAQDPLVPLYHPTSVVLVDDDPAALHAMTLVLQGAIRNRNASMRR